MFELEDQYIAAMAAKPVMENTTAEITMDFKSCTSEASLKECID